MAVSPASNSYVLEMGECTDRTGNYKYSDREQQRWDFQWEEQIPRGQDFEVLALVLADLLDLLLDVAADLLDHREHLSHQ
jgi:hypothetical protein